MVATGEDSHVQAQFHDTITLHSAPVVRPVLDPTISLLFFFFVSFYLCLSLSHSLSLSLLLNLVPLPQPARRAVEQQQFKLNHRLSHNQLQQ